MCGHSPSSPDSLRILRIARALYPDSVGGGAIHAHSMSKLQTEMGHEVTVISTNRGNQTLAESEHREGYTIQRHDELLSVFGNSIAPGMVKSLRRNLSEYDIVHAHSHLSFMSNVSALVTRLDDTPFVITNHGIRSQTAPVWVQDVYLPTIGRYTFNSADLVFTYSDVERDRLKNLGVTAPVSVIHNGVDCSKFAPSNEADHGHQLLFVGRLRKSKGPHLLIDVFDRLRSEFPDLRLKIVGEGPMRTELVEDVSERGLTGNVEFVGEVSNDQIGALYNESTVFVLPTNREGVPRTILEAMACATPVVATNLPQVRPVVSDGGVVVDRDVDSFSTVIGNLLESPDRRRQIGNRGRERVLDNYSWQETVHLTTEQYYNVMDRHV